VKFKAGLLIGLGAGYVLGTRAGQERYQQIAAAARAFLDNPGVQRLSGEVNKTVAVSRDRVTDAAKEKVEQASTGLQEQAGKAKEFVSNKVGAKKDGNADAGATKRSEPEVTPAGTVPTATGPATEKLPT